ncbi:MAG TPA: carbohydrate-binding family 9-like protein [Chryseosolibacter sp.]
MKQIEIPYCEAIGKDSAMGDISGYLNALEFMDIDTQSWPEFSYKPSIRFAMAHSGDCIFLKFNVLEKYVQAAYSGNNEPVSKDFYKCGDNLPEPHFITWNDVKAPKPDFHLPEFFGRINFL